MQNHLWIYQPLLVESQIDYFISEIEKRGLQIASTETTISISRTNPLTGQTTDNVISGDEALKKQVEYLDLLLRIFLDRNSSVSFFGLTDSVSMFNDLNNLDAQALPLGINYEKRVMYYKILQILCEKSLSQNYQP